jgi:hypothetical protein
VSSFTVFLLVDIFKNFLRHSASATDREAWLVLSGLAFDIQSRRIASTTDWEAKLVLIDPAFDIRSKDATTNLNVEEDFTSKDLVFDWLPALKEEHVLFDLRP